MAYKTTSNAKGLIIMEAELKQKNEEITELRRYRKRAKKAYRQLQAAHERISKAYMRLYWADYNYRYMIEDSDAKKPNKKS